MKRILIIAAMLAIAALALPDNLSGSTARCVGADPCAACKTCEHCQRCAKQGLTCGVCKPRKKPGE
jgi:hypothetical protein